MSSPRQRSSPSKEPGPSTSSGSSKRQNIERQNLTLPQPSSPPGSPRQRVDSVFADVCPRLSSDEIEKTILEEMEKLFRKQEIDSAILDDSTLFSWKHLEQFCGQILFQRDAYLRAEYTKVLNSKLAEQHESLLKLAIDQLQNQFEDADDPSYMM